MSSLTTGTVSACACCGTDNTWTQRTVSLSGYRAELLKTLRFTFGSFDDAPAYETLLDITEIDFSNNALLFKTSRGQLVLSLEKSVQHRMSDITFITDKNYKYTDEARIYHEFIITGKLLIPASIVAEFKNSKLNNNMQVKLILQGIGNACTGKTTFKKWLLKPVRPNTTFSGSGEVR